MLPSGKSEFPAILGGDGGAEQERGLNSVRVRLPGRFFRMEIGRGGTGGMEEERRVVARREEREGWEERWEGNFPCCCANALRLLSEGSGSSKDCELLPATLPEGKPTLGLVDLTGADTGTAVTVTSERGDASGLHMSGSSNCTIWERVLRRERDEVAEEGVSGRPVRPRGPSESVSVRKSSVSDSC